MDITFACSHCHQQLEVDSSASGTNITCPACNKHITVPVADITNIHHVNPMASSAASKEEKHFSVPVHDTPTEVLVKKTLPTLEIAKDGQRTMRVRCIKRTECVEVGKDLFEEVVSKFLAKIGEEHVISISAINYSHIDMGTRQILTDFGVMIVFRG